MRVKYVAILRSSCALIGFVAITVFKLHSRLPEKIVDSQKDEVPEIEMEPVEIIA